MADIKDNIEILKWQIEMGVDEIIGEKPVNRFLEEDPKVAKPTLNVSPSHDIKPPDPKSVEKPPQENINSQDAVTEATKLVADVNNLEDLRKAILEFPHCSFRNTSNNLVFSDGNPEAWLMILGEAPGYEEDMKGKPFVGKSGRLLDKIFSETGISRSNSKPHDSFYITNTINWRPPGNRNPIKNEIEMFRPFVIKHIELINPKILVLSGNIACTAILNQQGITKLRGKWLNIDNLHIMPIVHPAFLLRNPTFKKNTWQDVLAIKKKLVELT